MPRRPRIRRPKLASVPNVKAPPHWALTGASARAYPIRELRRSEKREPAGNPPPWWQGTRPEWAVYWALTILGLKPGIDFEYRAHLPGGEFTKRGEVDFLVYSHLVAIEVQGIHWHYALGEEQLQRDALKRILVESRGFVLVAIDEDLALSSPLWVVREALAGRDHSRGATDR